MRQLVRSYDLTRSQVFLLLDALHSLNSNSAVGIYMNGYRSQWSIIWSLYGIAVIGRIKNGSVGRTIKSMAASIVIHRYSRMSAGSAISHEVSVGQVNQDAAVAVRRITEVLSGIDAHAG